MSDNHHDDEHHEHSLKPHIFNLLALFGLTTLTWFSAAYLKFGEPWDNLIALGIAITKASLVILIFMHVKEATRLVKVCAFGGFFWIFLFFAYLVGDVLTRPGTTTYEGWQPDVRKAVEAPIHHGHGGGHEGGHGHGEGHGAGHGEDHGHGGGH